MRDFTKGWPVDLSVVEAAERLGVHRSRVQQLLASGELAGRRTGGLWLVDGDALERWSVHARAPWRPMAPARAWGLLDLLDGGDAAWLPPVARSQVRAKLRSLRLADVDQWRGLLRRRSDVHQLRVHPAALKGLEQLPVIPAGAEAATRLGADLVVVQAVPEIYVRRQDWDALAVRLQARVVHADANLVVRLPRELWPFEGDVGVGRATLGADLLESVESRAVDAGLRLIREGLRVWS